MSQDPAPYDTELVGLAQGQSQTLPFVPFIRFRHALEGLARQAAAAAGGVPPAAQPTEGRFTFHEDTYVATYVLDHPGRKVVVRDISRREEGP